MRLVIAGVHSGVGKTTITSGLVAAMRKRGLTVQPFKVGPDYIDPGYHSMAAGRTCRNLDAWMVSPERVTALFHYYAQQTDIAIIEGVMGLFDGINYLDDTGSTAQIARLTGSPVILIIDASCAARSAAATALGFQLFDAHLPLAGFIVNYACGDSHGAGVARAIEKATGLPVLGCLKHNPDLIIPERQLGLIPTCETGKWQEFIDLAARHVSDGVDINSLLKIAASAPEVLPASPVTGLFQRSTEKSLPRPRIAVARDEAFNFIYQENLDLLQAAGAEIAFFSPLHDKALPAGTSGVILSGGFPELFAEQISANKSMHQSLTTAHERKLPIYAECGGLMVLTQAILDPEGHKHAMIGLLPGKSVMTGKLNMGYRPVKAACDSWLMEGGEEVRGHEFHYSTWEDRPETIQPAYILTSFEGAGISQPEGAVMGSLWASYIHLSFWAKPELAWRFTSRCRERSCNAI